MASEKKKSGKGSNLRILSIAYATGRLDRDAYIRLRTAQLSSLNFNKPIPPLPEELADIEVPMIKIDSPYMEGSSKKFNPRLWIAAAVVLLVLISGAYIAFSGGIKLDQKPAKQPTLAGLADELLAAPIWKERDIDMFKDMWADYSDPAKAKAREAEWYVSLENEIIKRINQKKLERESTDDLREYQKQLNALRVFYAELTIE